MATTRMVRKQIYISQEQEERLKRRAQRDGRSEADIIRQGLSAVLDEPADGLTREEAWAQEVAFMRERLAMEVPQRRRMWKREDLYDERLSKLPGGHQRSALSTRSD